MLLRAAESLRMPKTTEDDVEAYLESFERAALAENWSPERWANYLSPLFVRPRQPIEP